MPDPKAVRRTIIDMLYRGGAAHLGTNMSMVEILIAIYSRCDIDKIRSHADDRDRVIISKGHGAAATYAVMHHYDLLTEKEIARYHLDGSLLGGHISHHVPHVEHSTGAALGHGLPVAVGIALGLRARAFNNARVFVILGDGECQEGANFEALMLARHHKLSNLTVIVDANGLSSIGRTDDVIEMAPVYRAMGEFGDLVICNGHNINHLTTLIRVRVRTRDKPNLIVARTVKGKGVPFAENEAVWHYRQLTKETYAEAIACLSDQWPFGDGVKA